MLSRRILTLFAKAPIPGEVKTRLCPPLEPGEAAALYEAMLLDILDQHAVSDGIDRALWYTPSEAATWFEAAVPAGYRLCLQCGEDLATRMRRLFQVHAEEGYGRIVLRGTDSPTLPSEHVGLAFEALERVDLVLGADRDGGYNLIGLRGPADRLFELEMSTAGVLEATLCRAEQLGLRVELLSSHHDVDTAADLERLLPELSRERTPRTLLWLASAHARLEG